MTLRRPLVRIGGQTKQLPPTDGIHATDSASLGGRPATDYTRVAQVVFVPGTRALGLDDAGNYLVSTAATAVTLTIPPQSTTAWAPFTEIHVEQGALGQVTIAAGAGVTLQCAASAQPVTREAHLPVTLKRKTENVWVVFGGLEDAP